MLYRDGGLDGDIVWPLRLLSSDADRVRVGYPAANPNPNPTVLLWVVGAVASVIRLSLSPKILSIALSMIR